MISNNIIWISIYREIDNKSQIWDFLGWHLDIVKSSSKVQLQIEKFMFQIRVSGSSVCNQIALKSQYFEIGFKSTSVEGKFIAS